MFKDKKVVILLLDSMGIGAAKDADVFRDVGSDTLGHIVDYFKEKNLDFKLPNLAKRGLNGAYKASTGQDLSLEIGTYNIENSKYGCAAEVSKGKDTPSGHWEIAGVPVLFDWYYFKKTTNSNESCFDKEFIARLNEETGQDFIDAGHASGTEVLKELGSESCMSKKPIIYTSADSVFQIAAHEDYFGLEKLLEICVKSREILDDMNLCVGRVIARPFIGESADTYARTANRRDYSILPPDATLLDNIKSAGGEVIGIGKISDIYATQGITKKVKASTIDGLFDATVEEYTKAEPNTLIFTNFVDFDSSFGHRRDTKGYGEALMQFDARLPDLEALLDDDTVIVVAADHGCDPTWEGIDHTREHIPFLLWGKEISTECIGTRETFADIGKSIADYMGVDLNNGTSVL